MAQTVKFQTENYIGAMEIDNDEFMEWSNGIGISRVLGFAPSEVGRILERYSELSGAEIQKIG